MFNVSATGVFILLVAFFIFLTKAYYDDKRYMDKIINNDQECIVCAGIGASDLTDPKVFHSAVIDTVKHENRHGQFADSKVKRILTSARDMVVRGIIMGALEGSAENALQGAVTWSLAGGIVSGIGDLFGWRSKFYDMS